MAIDPLKPIERRDFEAYTENCNGEVSRRVFDPCASSKLDQLIAAVNNQSGGASGQYAQFLAGETMSALKFVYVGPDNKIYLGDSTNLNSSSVIGITVSAGATNSPINVLSFGPFFDPTFAYGYSNQLYLTTLGNVSTTSPSVGHRVKVGQGLADGGIFIDIDEIVIL